MGGGVSRLEETLWEEETNSFGDDHERTFSSSPGESKPKNGKPKRSIATGGLDPKGLHQTLDGDFPTPEYKFLELRKRGVGQREYDVVDHRTGEVYYTTRAVPGSLSWFDVLGPASCGDYCDWKLRVVVQGEFRKKTWIVYRYHLPVFEGQEAVPLDHEVMTNVPAGIRMYKTACIVVSWSRYVAIMARYGKPNLDDYSFLAFDHVDDATDDDDDENHPTDLDEPKDESHTTNNNGTTPVETCLVDEEETYAESEILLTTPKDAIQREEQAKKREMEESDCTTASFVDTTAESNGINDAFENNSSHRVTAGEKLGVMMPESGVGTEETVGNHIISSSHNENRMATFHQRKVIERRKTLSDTQKLREYFGDANPSSRTDTSYRKKGNNRITKEINIKESFSRTRSRLSASSSLRSFRSNFLSEWTGTSPTESPTKAEDVANNQGQCENHKEPAVASENNSDPNENHTKTPQERYEMDMEGVLDLDNPSQPIVQCQEIRSKMFGNHQTFNMSKKGLLDLLLLDTSRNESSDNNNNNSTNENDTPCNDQDKEDSQINPGQRASLISKLQSLRSRQHIAQSNLSSSESKTKNEVNGVGDSSTQDTTLDTNVAMERDDVETIEKNSRPIRSVFKRQSDFVFSKLKVWNNNNDTIRDDHPIENDGNAKRIDQIEMGRNNTSSECLLEKSSETKLAVLDGNHPKSSTNEWNEPVVEAAPGDGAEECKEEATNDCSVDTQIQDNDETDVVEVKEKIEKETRNQVDTNDKDDGESLSHCSAPLVSYFYWKHSSFRMNQHKMLMHLAVNADMALHVVFAILVNQVRFERNHAVLFATGIHPSWVFIDPKNPKETFRL